MTESNFVGSTLSCWNCIPALNMSLECLQRSTYIPKNPLGTISLPQGLSSEVCSGQDPSCMTSTMSIYSSYMIIF